RKSYRRLSRRRAWPRRGRAGARRSAMGAGRVSTPRRRCRTERLGWSSGRRSPRRRDLGGPFSRPVAPDAPGDPAHLALRERRPEVTVQARQHGLDLLGVGPFPPEKAGDPRERTLAAVTQTEAGSAGLAVACARQTLRQCTDQLRGARGEGP